MRKVAIAIALCFGLTAPLMAQDTNADPTLSRRGFELLPKAGDYAIGIEATPFFKYFGNMFNNSTDNPAPLFNGVDQTIYGKYFLKDDVAIRAKLRLNLLSDKFKQTVADDHAIITNPTNVAATTVDVLRIGTTDIDLSVGYEMRRGKGRVQGFYGGEFTIGYYKTNHTYEYGNGITQPNQNPSSHNFQAINGVQNMAPTQGYRITEIKGGSAFNLGLGAFVGVEYFFAPKISIGGELGLGFIYSIKGQNEVTSEGYLNNGVREYSYRNFTAASGPHFEAGINTRTSGNIFVLFHF